jgi:hypothetical protein
MCLAHRGLVRLEPIHKTPRDLRVPPHLGDYAREAASFSWAAARREIDGLPGGRGLNIAHEAVDRHAPKRGCDRPPTSSALSTLWCRIAPACSR